MPASWLWNLAGIEKAIRRILKKAIYRVNGK